jgi:hypothetical protein
MMVAALSRAATIIGVGYLLLTGAATAERYC